MRNGALGIALAVVTSVHLLGSPGGVHAAPGLPPLFGTDASAGNLLAVHPVTGVGSILGFMDAGTVPALAVDPTTGILYAGQGGGSPNLYTVNPTTGAATLVGDTGLGFAAFSDMDFRADGTLYASVNIAGNGGTGGDHLAIIDKTTGAATIIGSFGTCTDVTIPSQGGGSCSIEGLEAIAFDSLGKLWGTVRVGGPSAPGLYLINTATGAATFQHPILDAGGNPPSGGVVSLRFLCGDTLYGGTARAVAPANDGGRLITIIQSSGLFAYIGSTSAARENSLGGLAFLQGCQGGNTQQPPIGAIPTLSTWVMIGLAGLIAALGGFAIRRRDARAL